MLLGTTIQYASIIVTEMKGAVDPVKAYNIVKKHNLSPSFVDQICRKLRDAGILKSLRGPGGGYNLAKEQVTVGELINILSTAHAHEVLPGAVLINEQVNHALAGIHL